MKNKKLNKKGFTLVELLAVIVVLAIILVITVPMILNTLGNTSANAFQSSAQSAADFYREQLQLKALGSGSGETDFLPDVVFTSEKVTIEERPITKEEAEILGLDKDTYELVENCTANNIDSVCSSPSGSTVKIENNKVTVKLVAKSKGKFDGVTPTNGDTPGTATATK